MTEGQMGRAIAAIVAEYERAIGLYPQNHPFHNHHEALAVLLEEVEEYKALVFAHERNWEALEKMRHELIQIAAVALGVIVEITN